MALRVLETSPKHKETSVDLDSKIEVEFTHDIDGKTINRKSFSLVKDGEVIDGNISYKPYDKKATFQPSKKLQPDSSYRVVLSSKIQSSNGDNLETGYSFEFQTFEADYKLSYPTITQPADNEVLEQPVISWNEVEKADSYSVEISDRPDFNNLYYSTFVFDRTHITPNLENDKEYHVRVKANNVARDNISEDTVYITIDDLINYGDNYFEYELPAEYKPLQSLLNIKVGNRVLNIDDFGRSKAGEAYIKSNKQGIIVLNYPVPKDKGIEIKLEYLPTSKDSSWSNTVSFFYDRDALKIEDALNNLGLRDEKFMEISPKFQVDPDTEVIYLKLHYGHLDIEDIDIILEGIAVNDNPNIEDHGVITGHPEHEIEIYANDLNKMTNYRYEYYLPQEYLALIELDKVEFINKDITHKVNIIDRKKGLISFDFDIMDMLKKDIDGYYTSNSSDVFEFQTDPIDYWAFFKTDNFPVSQSSTHNFFTKEFNDDTSVFATIKHQENQSDVISFRTKIDYTKRSIKIKYKFSRLSIHEQTDEYTIMRLVV